jgi:prepilin-type N-terminal cleavage/methylation domain-containing protein
LQQTQNLKSVQQGLFNSAFQNTYAYLILNRSSMRKVSRDDAGMTLVELMVTMTVFLVVAGGFLTLFLALVNSSVFSRRAAVALTLATNQMEYIKSLPYDNLAVQGGSIISSSYIPATLTKTVDNVNYKVTTSISYVDDAFDGCGSYPSQAIKAEYCRGYNSNTTSTIDTNPADYKVVDITVTDAAGNQLSQVDTEIAARVAETASTTGAMFVTVDDSTGAPIEGATVQVTNSKVSPAVSVSDVTDENGLAIFYDLPPDSTADYVISASNSGYSSLNTIAASGSLQPTYPNLTILTQQSSAETLVLKQMGTPSLLLQTTNTNGTALAGVKVYAKGGYKKYTATSDTNYYYDNMSGGDTRPTTDSGGLAGLSNLVPGPYYFCGDSGATSCSVGSTTYYLAAAVPYSGTTALSPINIPTYDPDTPPSPLYAYGGNSYFQKVQLLLTTSSTFPRLTSLTPSTASLSSGNITSFPFTLTGANLPCSSVASSCSTTVKLTQGSATFTASCTGTSSGLNLSCSVNLSSAAIGGTQLVISTSNGSLTLPASPELGGITIGQ